MRAHITADVKKQVKQMKSELAVIPGGLTKELKPLDIGVNRPFKVRLRTAWERWMSDGDHSFTKCGRQRLASYATICEWIVDAWLKCLLALLFKLLQKPASFQRSRTARKVTLTVKKVNLPCLMKIWRSRSIQKEDEDFDGFD